jgi:hypothetical protein
MREMRLSGSMSGVWKRSRMGLVRHRQTKGSETDRPHLNHRVTPRLYACLRLFRLITLGVARFRPFSLIKFAADAAAVMRSAVDTGPCGPFRSSLLPEPANRSYARWASCLTAPIVEGVARATSSMLIPFTLSMVSTARWRSDNQVAHAAVKTKSSLFQAPYRRFVIQLGQNKAIWAITHRLCRLTWKILHQGVRYIEFGTRSNSKAAKTRINRLIRELRSLGYQVQLSQMATP